MIRHALGADIEDTAHDRETATEPGALTRRGLVRTTWAAAGVAVLATAGNSVGWLREVSVLAVRSGEGPQGVPVTRSAAAARVEEVATGDDYRLEVVHGSTTRRFTLEELRAMPQHSEELPIACVEGWSASGTWRGVRLRTLLDAVGAPADASVSLESLEESGPFRRSTLPGNFADDDRTLVALELNGEPLDLDHGYPARLIAPNRPGVKQTKWLGRITA